jgi:hypothetical protein
MLQSLVELLHVEAVKPNSDREIIGKMVKLVSDSLHGADGKMDEVLKVAHLQP